METNSLAIRTKPMDALYQPLDLAEKQIRLTRLLEPLEEQKTSCRISLEVFDLDNAPAYSALSYRWGAASPLHSVSVNDHHVVTIRDNLHNFFIEYQHLDNDPDAPSPSKYLWVDQVCIEQANTSERNHQVQLMSEIYSKAGRVLVWLGSGEERHSENDKTYQEAAINYNKMSRSEHSQDRRLRETESDIIICNPYFHRLWIVQELLLAQKQSFLVGNTWWHPVFLDLLGAERKCKVMGFIGKRHWSRDNNRKISLKACLWTFVGLQCMNPVDCIYGLMGIVKPEQVMVVDYSKSVQQLYAEVVEKLIRSIPEDLVDENSANYFDVRVTSVGIFYSILNSLVDAMGFPTTQQDALDHFNHKVIEYFASFPSTIDFFTPSKLIHFASQIQVGFESVNEDHIEGVWWCNISGEKFEFDSRRTYPPVPRQDPWTLYHMYSQHPSS